MSVNSSSEVSHRVSADYVLLCVFMYCFEYGFDHLRLFTQFKIL
jgi:hypothetical protein